MGDGNFAVGLICCVGPLVWTAMVFWAGKGFPGWPWKVSVSKRTFKNYYENEDE